MQLEFCVTTPENECLKPKRLRKSKHRVTRREIELAKLVLMPGVEEVIKHRNYNEVLIDATICRTFGHWKEKWMLNAIRKAVILANRNFGKYADTLVLEYTEEDKQKWAQAREDGICDDNDGENPNGWTVSDCFEFFDELSDFVPAFQVDITPNKHIRKNFRGANHVRQSLETRGTGSRKSLRHQKGAHEGDG